MLVPRHPGWVGWMGLSWLVDISWVVGMDTAPLGPAVCHCLPWPTIAPRSSTTILTQPNAGLTSDPRGTGSALPGHRLGRHRHDVCPLGKDDDVGSQSARALQSAVGQYERDAGDTRRPGGRLAFLASGQSMHQLVGFRDHTDRSVGDMDTDPVFPTAATRRGWQAAASSFEIPA